MDSKQIIKKAKQAAKSKAKDVVAHQDVDRSGYTITQVAEVMSNVMLEAIDIFNLQSKEMYKDRPGECPEMKINIVPMQFTPEHYVATGVESRATFTLEMKQFGLTTVLFRDGIEFTCERDRKNINAWLPKIWQKFFQYIVNTSMFYNLALNPDNPEVRKAAAEAKLEA